MALTWLTTVAWFYLGVCFVCAAAVTYDIFFNRRRQPMGVMDAVYPITALYFGPFALALYGRWARRPARPEAVPNPGGIVDRVVTLSNGEYEVHNMGVNWPHYIFVNKNFKVIGAN